MKKGKVVGAVFLFLCAAQTICEESPTKSDHAKTSASFKQPASNIQIISGMGIGALAAGRLRHEWKAYKSVADEFTQAADAWNISQWERSQPDWKSLQRMCGGPTTAPTHEEMRSAVVRLQRCHNTMRAACRKFVPRASLLVGILGGCGYLVHNGITQLRKKIES